MFKLMSTLSLLLFISIGQAATIPAGTEIKVRVAETVNSQMKRVGSQFKLLTEGDFQINNKIVIKNGSKAFAKVSKIKPATKSSEAEIEVTLTQLYINRKATSVSTFPQGGKGTLNYTTELGTKNLDRDEITSSTGEPISNTIPVSNSGNYVEINKGTIIYFITSKDITY
nr:hypothetical protein BCCFPMHH_00035 [uncultured bacterium]